MTPYININGELIPAERALFRVTNRAFHYGDGLFETMKLSQDRIPFLYEHIKRLRNGMKLLGLQHPHIHDPEFLQNEILRLVRRVRLSEGARIRLTVFREGEGRYTPETDQAGYCIEAEPAETIFQLNDFGFNIDVFKKYTKSIHPLNAVKSINSQLFIQAARFKKQNNLNEALILNDKGNVVESISSNVFFVVKDKVITPAIDQGCLPGVMRSLVIEMLRKGKIEVFETAVKPQILLECREVFFTNAVQGIQYAMAYEDKRYFHKLSEQLVNALNTEVDLRVNLMKDLPETDS